MLLLKRHLLAYLDLNVQMYTLCQENPSVKLSMTESQSALVNLLSSAWLIGCSLTLVVVAGPLSFLTSVMVVVGGGDSPTLEGLLLCFWKKIWKGRWSNLRVAYLRLALRFSFYASSLALDTVLFVYVQYTGNSFSYLSLNCQSSYWLNANIKWNLVCLYIQRSPFQSVLEGARPSILLFWIWDYIKHLVSIYTFPFNDFLVNISSLKPQVI